MRQFPIRRFRQSEAGGVALVMALLLPAVAAAAGFAVDYSRGVTARQEARRHLDSALLSAARLPAGERKTAGENLFHAHRMTDYSAVATITEATAEKLLGTANVSVPSYFGALIGMPYLEASVESEVRVIEIEETGGTGSTAGPRACIVLKGQSDYDELHLNTGAQIDGPECEIHVHSEQNPAALFHSGIEVDVSRICVKGAGVTNHHGTIDSLETGCTPPDDPFAGALPIPAVGSCDHNGANYTSGTFTLEPGTYCGWYNFDTEATVTFEPGLYVLKDGGWNVNGGTWNGDGATFYFHDQSKIQFNKGVTASLAPPASGEYEGIMFYEREGLAQSDFILNDTLDFDISGLVYLPSRNGTYNAGAVWKTRKMTLVLNTLLVNQAMLKLEGGPLGISAGGEIATPATDAATVVKVTRGRIAR